MNHTEDRILRLEAKLDVVTRAVQTSIVAINQIDPLEARRIIAVMKMIADGHRKDDRVLSAAIADEFVVDLRAVVGR